MPAAIQDRFFEPKRVGETVPVSFDFFGEMSTGDTLSGSVWTVTVVEGVDSNPNDMLQGTPVIDGAVVTHLISGGISGVIYCINCNVNSSSGAILEGAGLIKVSDRCF